MSYDNIVHIRKEARHQDADSSSSLTVLVSSHVLGAGGSLEPNADQFILPYLIPF